METQISFLSIRERINRKEILRREPRGRTQSWSEGSQYLSSSFPSLPLVSFHIKSSDILFENLSEWSNGFYKFILDVLIHNPFVVLFQNTSIFLGIHVIDTGHRGKEVRVHFPVQSTGGLCT